MSDLKSKKQKHMSLEDRLEIQSCLDHGMTFKAIAQRIGKDQTTISKEVKKHITVNPDNFVTAIDPDGNITAKQPCPQVLKSPFVCNGCKKRRTRCAYQKQLYLVSSAASIM